MPLHARPTVRRRVIAWDARWPPRNRGLPRRKRIWVHRPLPRDATLAGGCRRWFVRLLIVVAMGWAAGVVAEAEWRVPAWAWALLVVAAAMGIVVEARAS